MPDGCRQREGQAGDAGGDRRIVDGDAEEQPEAENPCERRVAEMLMPAIEIEIGEQEDHETGREEPSVPARHMRSSSAVTVMSFERKPNRADIGKHGPGSAAVAGSIDVPLTTEKDRQEHREQPGNAEQRYRGKG